MPTIAHLLETLNARYPLADAESWDNVGLQIGDAKASVQKVLLAHEVTDTVLDQTAGYDALVIYHPLIFGAFKTLNFTSHTARLAARAIRQNLAVIAVHTALDNAAPPKALGDFAAQQLQLQDVQVLAPTSYETLKKLIVFVPAEAHEKVRQALWEAGAGHIGNYDQTSFNLRGTGTFRPLEGSDPYSGKQGELEQADEFRLEVIVPAAQLSGVINALKKAHPYEEPAFDIYHLDIPGSARGAARQGNLPKSYSLKEFSQNVARQLQPPNLRIVGDLSKTISKVAVVPGSGVSFLEDAVRARCDCLVTGDIKHHDALKAQALGITLLDVTHDATESAALGMMKKAITKLPGIDVDIYDGNTNPFTTI